jgi:hypothetical protein
MLIAALVEQTMVQAVSRGWSAQSTASLFRLREKAAGIEVASDRGDADSVLRHRRRAFVLT